MPKLQRQTFTTRVAIDLIVLCLLLTSLCSLARAEQDSPFPPQLEAVVPYQPTAFASDGRQRLVYEVLLRNYESKPLTVQSLDVLDADAPTARAVASYDAMQLPKMMNAIGARLADNNAVLTLQPGGSAIVYLMLTLNPGAKVPARLQHRWYTSIGEVTTAAIITRNDMLRVVGPPLTGSGWLAETGLSNDNGHRRGYTVLQGRPVTSRRYAFDWIKQEGSDIFRGDSKDNATYFGFGQPVIAVADAVVESVIDGVPLNNPGRHLAVPMTLATMAGNLVVLDLGAGSYAYYMHLQPGSLRVKPGDHVKRGQVLGLVGNTGNSFAPHLHFEITNSPQVLSGEGVPYVFDSFNVLQAAGKPAVPHQRELPLEKMVVDFSK